MPKTKVTAQKRPINNSHFPKHTAIKSGKPSLITEKTIMEADEYMRLQVTKKSTPAQISIPIGEKNQIIRKKIQKKDKVRTKERTNCIAKSVFQKLIRDIANNNQHQFKFQQEALTALQIVAEDFMIGFFEDSQRCATHANRKTVMLKDIQLVAKLRKIDYEPL